MGDWCAYSAYNTGLDSDIYREFYNYIYKIFEEEGANSYILYVLIQMEEIFQILNTMTVQNTDQVLINMTSLE